MYVSPFLCGVIATIGTEILLTIALAIYLSARGKKKGEEK